MHRVGARTLFVPRVVIVGGSHYKVSEKVKNKLASAIFDDEIKVPGDEFLQSVRSQDAKDRGFIQRLEAPGAPKMCAKLSTKVPPKSLQRFFQRTHEHSPPAIKLATVCL